MSEEITGDDFYLSPRTKKVSRFTVQGSRFIAKIAPCSSEEEAQRLLSEVVDEYPDATHHAYALRIGMKSTLIERANDDGEPAGTAGAPMLQFLKGKNISDVLIVGTRYFGGIKLGIGGLTRAYRDCARISLEQSDLTRKESLSDYILEFNYEDLGAVTRIVESSGGTIIASEYSDKVLLKARIPSRSDLTFTEGFESACRGRGTLKKFSG
ncbi:MAG: YigZ family protein [Bacillota bacterium]|nr:YigZ family protein [Bacillota bacterium]